MNTNRWTTGVPCPLFSAAPVFENKVANVVINLWIFVFSSTLQNVEEETARGSKKHILGQEVAS
jgi:hypothetical protein